MSSTRASSISSGGHGDGRRSLRSASEQPSDTVVRASKSATQGGQGGSGSSSGASGASKRKQPNPLSKTEKEKLLQDSKCPPRIHAQRKFAQGQGSSSASSSPVKTVRPSSNAGGNPSSSSSSTASGPTTKGQTTGSVPKVAERPKTEDFLTFLCLRGTSLLPPELDFFNKATVAEVNNSSEEESSDNDGNITGAVARKTVRRIARKELKKANTSVLAKKLPASMQALKKKYADQRLAKKVVSKTLPSSATRRTRSQAEEVASSRRKAVIQGSGGGPKTRSGRGITSPAKSGLNTRKPSAAALIAKRKTQMATLTAASSRVSRMLTCLTPRGTSTAAFVKSAKKIPMAGRSLRGRDISLSSEEDESDDEAQQVKKTPPKRRLKSRQAMLSKKSEESESDADGETSSRDSSRKRSTQANYKATKLNSQASLFRKREGRSVSRDSSVSKDSSRSDTTGNQRLSRKTKVAATVYLNMLGQKLTSKQDDDVISIESLSEATQEERLNKVKGSSKTQVRNVITPSIRKRSGDGNGSTTDSERRKMKKEGDKKKGKQSLKQLQDMLLEEAKKKIATTPNTEKTDSDTGDSEERFTISQRTGYIQVKPRKSTDQPIDEPTAMNPAMVGPNGRRLSKTSDRMPTPPPRKILPKSGPDSGAQGHQSHLPVGVMGASRIATPLKTNSAGGIVTNTPIPGVPIITMSNQQLQVPLTQPLVISTNFAGTTLHQQQQNTSGSNVHLTTPGTGFIMSSAGLRMPIQVPIQVRQGNIMGSQQQNTAGFPTSHVQGLPIINSAGGIQIAGMQQITLQPINSSGMQQPLNQQQPMQTVLRPPYGFSQPLITQPITTEIRQHQVQAVNPHITSVTSRPQFQGQVPQQYQQIQQQQILSKTSNAAAPSSALSHAVTTTISSHTSVTTANSQPLISPGPPMLSPQIEGEKKQMVKGPMVSESPLPALRTVTSNVRLNPSQLMAGHQSQALPSQPIPRAQMAPSNPIPHFVQNPYSTASMSMQSYPQTTSYGYPQHQIYQQVYNGPMHHHMQHQPIVSNPYYAQPSPSPSTSQQSQQQYTTIKATSPSKAEKSKSIFTKTSEKKLPKTAGSFRVDNEASPYAFESESAEPSFPYRKPSQPKAGSSKGSSSSKQKKRPDDDLAIQCNLENAKEMGSSIPIPKELASQLVSQAKKEGNTGNSEMTYFIPLQSSSGQSFGVSVKLGTEGPAGPNQKVIMKAKLVTQPSGKPVGARVIGAREDSSTATTSETGRKFVRMPMASPSSPKHSDSDSDDSQPSTSTGRLGSPDSGLSASRKKKYKDIAKHVKEENETCMGSLEMLDRFPKLGQHAHLLEAPVYTPTEKEFKDPLKYIERIRKDAEQFGFCKIIPPSSFKPECNVDDDMRFTAYNQVIQKMMNRWGPNAKEMAAIRKYLDTQNIVIKPHPMVGGVEIDLPALYHAVQSFGGLTEVIQRKRWAKIADYLRIPKGTQDRGNKLDDIYCKYLLPYDTLSSVEREELLRLVEEEFEERNKKKLDISKNDEEEEVEAEEDDSEDENYECVLKGKSTSLSAFFRVARNLMMMIFKQSDPEIKEVEEEYWRLVMERDSHVQVHQGSIDTGDEGFGFPTSRASSCGRHPWNLKILSNNPKSLLRCMGPVMGVTVPTLNVGMVFTSGCWYRDPHGLPWVDYHHTGAPKIWYGVPDSHSIAFYTAMKQLVPTFCRKKKIWLPADTAMVPPNLLVKYGVPVCRMVQEPGQFLVIFPKTYTSYVCTGYSISESVYYAPRDYLSIAENEFKAIRDSGEPMMFPFTKFLLCVAQDELSTKETLRLVKPFLEKIRDNEYVKQTMLADLGVKVKTRIVLKAKKQEQDDEYECEVCSENLYVSYMCDVNEDTYYCMEHAIEYLQDRKVSQRKQCKIFYTHSKEEISAIIKMLNKRLDESDDSSSSSADDDIEIRRVIEKRPIVHERKANIQSQSTNPTFVSHSSSKGKQSVKRKPKEEIETKAEKKAREKKAEKKEKAKKKGINKSKKECERAKVDDDDDDDDDSSEDSSEESEEESEEEEEEEEVKKPQKKRKAGAAEKVPTLKRRKTKVRKAAQDKAGNLAGEILDMLLSASEEDSDASDKDEDSSDESWK